MHNPNLTKLYENFQILFSRNRKLFDIPVGTQGVNSGVDTFVVTKELIKSFTKKKQKF